MLGVPALESPTVYLDLGHWYALGEAKAGHPRQESHPEILAKLEGEAAAGRLIFPLSAMHYIELNENPRDAQRREAAQVMAAFSKFTTMASIGRIIDEEMARSFNKMCGRPMFPVRVPKFGNGVGYAFGETADSNEEVDYPKEYAALEGAPQALRSHIPNYDAYVGRKIADSELNSFNLMLETLRTDPDIAARPLDAICSRQLLFDVVDNFVWARINAGFAKSLPPGLRSKEDFTAFVMSLPSRRVSTMMQFHYLKDISRNWTINDLRDVHLLSTAIPYCDVVLTDRKAWDTAKNRAHLDQEFSTAIFCSLDDLVAHLGLA